MRLMSVAIAQRQTVTSGHQCIHYQIQVRSNPVSPSLIAPSPYLLRCAGLYWIEGNVVTSGLPFVPVQLNLIRTRFKRQLPPNESHQK